ncbi:pseudouridine synthase [Desulfovibrio sp. UCD-KL4C]|uniref:pseudouridine synthase n=1 Tax=Desulfovibrio sp. UCD-KL4C TaxID=2578120 RepID=UPI0025C31DAD|nr:pseudouridine synthase [Desulfovibrio sp. UCD-KL4C]
MADSTKNTETIRLNKFIASAGISSRRGADELINQGKVKINGERVESPGVQVDPENDLVEVNGKPVQNSLQTKNIYILLNKPIETVTTAKDPQKRKTVLDLLSSQFRQRRVFPVGRLDFYSEGLLLLTTDGELCNRLTHPKWHLPKVYEVIVRGPVSSKSISIMESGMYLSEGDILAPVKVNILREGKDTTKVEMVLNQGVNRQIRRMFREFDITILRIKRTRQGKVELGDLPAGKWRELTASEVKSLQKDVGL